MTLLCKVVFSHLFGDKSVIKWKEIMLKPSKSNNFAALLLVAIKKNKNCNKNKKQNKTINTKFRLIEQEIGFIKFKQTFPASKLNLIVVLSRNII